MSLAIHSPTPCASPQTGQVSANAAELLLVLFTLIPSRLSNSVMVVTLALMPHICTKIEMSLLENLPASQSEKGTELLILSSISSTLGINLRAICLRSTGPRFASLCS